MKGRRTFTRFGSAKSFNMSFPVSEADVEHSFDRLFLPCEADEDFEQSDSVGDAVDQEHGIFGFLQSSNIRKALIIFLTGRSFGDAGGGTHYFAHNYEALFHLEAKTNSRPPKPILPPRFLDRAAWMSLQMDLSAPSSVGMPRSWYGRLWDFTGMTLAWLRAELSDKLLYVFLRDNNWEQQDTHEMTWITPSHVFIAQFQREIRTDHHLELRNQIFFRRINFHRPSDAWADDYLGLLTNGVFDEPPLLSQTWNAIIVPPDSFLIADKILAFVMCAHVRLGSETLWSRLHTDVLRAIARTFFKHVPNGGMLVSTPLVMKAAKSVKNANCLVEENSGSETEANPHEDSVSDDTSSSFISVPATYEDWALDLPDYEWALSLVDP